MDIQFVDGSCYYHQGKPCTGYASLQISINKILQGMVIPHLAQAAEVVAIAATLEAASPETDLLICSDSDWAVHVLTNWMLAWVK
ncbi:hypothetical protein G0U57_015337 [Chelydra serpentina]|uniref:RNase H type-1 domain-containing protein n=1 Tax=Chelydra serpentina TaxID=8475 RepID=A0A8T1T3E0_CHESE|nr:hypothetical protein G0U57_015337 [Chelydra serpentina]